MSSESSVTGLEIGFAQFEQVGRSIEKKIAHLEALQDIRQIKPTGTSALDREMDYSVEEELHACSRLFCPQRS